MTSDLPLAVALLTVELDIVEITKSKKRTEKATMSFGARNPVPGLLRRCALYWIFGLGTFAIWFFARTL